MPDEAPGGSRGRSRNRRILLCAAAASLAVVAAAGAYACWANRKLRFGCVEEGVLYRSAQPSGGQLDRIVRRYGIRTIVNLREPDSIAGDKRAQDEQALAMARGINFINIPYGHASSQSQIAEFLALIADPARRPILVHCSAGKERSGVVVAAYRMKVQGWKLQQAMAEMGQYGYDPTESTKYQADLDEFARSLAPEPPPQKNGPPP